MKNWNTTIKQEKLNIKKSKATVSDIYKNEILNTRMFISNIISINNPELKTIKK